MNRIKQHNTQAFLALVRGGLWQQQVRLSPFGKLDFEGILDLSFEQSLVGLTTAGMENITDMEIPLETKLQFVGNSIQIEQENWDMNRFLAKLVKRFNDNNIGFALVKGQGVAQCYEKPMWRSAGDIDFLLDDDNYEKGKIFLSGVADEVHEENPFDKHYSVEIGGISVELHGTMRGLLPKRVDNMIDAVQDDTFMNRKIRYWDNHGVSIPLPSADNDVIFVFTHILKHFFHYGIGLRQICDWCRLLWTYRSELDLNLLELRLRESGLMSEWRAFGALAVDILGMPTEAMPFYSSDNCWKRKAKRILSFVLETGNFGHNRDKSYLQEKPFVIGKAISFWRHTGDSIKQLFIFPFDTTKIWGILVSTGLGAVTRKVENR